MAAYLIVEHQITDAERFSRYISEVVPMIERWGGRYLTRGGSHQVLEGTWQPTRVAIIEFPDRATLDAFYASPGYQPVLALRAGAAVDVVIAIDGA